MLNKLYSWILRSYGNRNNAKCHRLPESSLLQMLEPRLMFDGAAVETVDIADGVSEVEQNYILKSLDENNQAKITESLLKAIQQDAEHVQTDYSQFKEVVIIDANVKDPHILLESISRDAAVEIILPNQNGVDAIADILQKYQNLDAVHIISHGEQAELSLGNIIFNSNNIGSYQLQLAQWGSALTEHGDILLPVYGEG